MVWFGVCATGGNTERSRRPVMTMFGSRKNWAGVPPTGHDLVDTNFFRQWPNAIIYCLDYNVQLLKHRADSS